MQTVRNGRTILVSEDDLELRLSVELSLTRMGYSVELARDEEDMLSRLRSSDSPIAAVLLSAGARNGDGLEALRGIRRFDAAIPVIVVSSCSSPQKVVLAMKNGATDFLCKPIVHDELQHAVSRAIEAGEAERLPAAGPASKSRTFFGTDTQMRELHALVGQVGWSEAPVLIQGETGSGKEVIARELHANSPRAAKPFLKLNCAALPSELVESELFGYERGAFTGAFQRKAGMFELADGGAILLDEIGDMDIRLQAKLLQVLQDHQFHRLGGKEMIHVDVRVMAATHRDLERAIIDRSFREDLYYRLNVITLEVPPLRERKDDIAPLAEFFLRKHAAEGPVPLLTLDLKHAMVAYHWPGNVRELENFVRKFLILRNADALVRELRLKASRRALLAASQDESGDDASPVLEQVTKAKHQAETEAILTALNSTRWNRKQAASLLRIDYKALLYKMKKLGLDERPLAAAI